MADPDPDRRDDVWSRERITAVLQASIEDRRHLNAHLKWVEIAVACMGVVLIMSMVAITGVPLTRFGGLIGANHERATETARIVQTIQRERRTNIRKGCADQNHRHDRTIRRLRRLVKQAPPAQRRRARRGLAGTISLIDALAPHHDCAQLLRRQVPSTTR